MGKRKTFEKIKKKKINKRKKKKDEQECANCSAPGREKQRAGERERERDGVRVYIGVNGRERLRDSNSVAGSKTSPGALRFREKIHIDSGQDDHVATWL